MSPSLSSPDRDLGNEDRANRAGVLSEWDESSPSSSPPKDVVVDREGSAPRPPGFLRRLLVAPLKFAIAVVCCQSFVLGAIVVGWTARLTQRFVWETWWRRGRVRRRRGEGFTDFAAGDPATEDHLSWPNFLLAQNFRVSLRRASTAPSFAARCRGRVAALAGSLWRNAKLGVGLLANTWALTGPGCALWMMSWIAGWNISFNKIYEQHTTGATIGLIGVGFFIIAMLYVPLAQARHAVTGEFRAFWDYRVIRAVIRERWIACFVLAGFFSLFTLPMSIFAILPQFFDQMSPALDTMTAAEAVDFLELYYIVAAIVAVPLFVLLRLMAGRIYASGLHAALRRGTVTPDDLRRVERVMLEKTGLLEVEPLPQRGIIVRLTLMASSGLGRGMSFVAVLLIWFTLVSQVYVCQFFNFRPAQGWLNQPMVHVPTLTFIPGHLTEDDE